MALTESRRDELEAALNGDLGAFLHDWQQGIDADALEELVENHDQNGVLHEMKLDDAAMLAALVALFARRLRDAFEEAALSEDEAYDPTAPGVADEISDVATIAAVAVIARAQETVIGTLRRETTAGFDSGFIAASLVGMMWTLDRQAAAIDARRARQIEEGVPAAVVAASTVAGITRAQDYRVELAVSTAITAAVAAGQMWTWPRGTVMMWVTQRDELVCDFCGPLDGQTRRIGQTWDEDDIVEAPPAHPRCRCSLKRVSG